MTFLKYCLVLSLQFQSANTYLSHFHLHLSYCIQSKMLQSTVLLPQNNLVKLFLSSKGINIYQILQATLLKALERNSMGMEKTTFLKITFLGASLVAQ